MIKKYLRVYKSFVENSISHEAQYRGDTIAKIATNILYLAMVFTIIEVIFNSTQSIAGWEKKDVYLLSVIWIMFDEMFICLFRENFYNLSLKMTRGELDTVLTKPINALFYTTTKQLLMRAFYRFVTQFLVLAWLIWHYDFTVSTLGVVLAPILFILGLAVHFAISLIANTLSFWFIKIDNINDAIGAINTMGRYPLGIWTRAIKVFFLTVVPIAFSAYIPVATLTGRWPWYGVVYAFLFTIAIFWLSVRFWNFALRRYSSASS